MKVLIVDDEPLVRRSLERALTARGHQVLLASDGTQGLKMWLDHAPELVFLDVLMPGLSGPEVLSEVSAHPSGLRAAQVVLMSAFTGGEHTSESAREMGADLFISKPFADIFQTLDHVEKALK